MRRHRASISSPPPSPPSPPPPTPFSVTYARRLVLPSRYIATSHSTSVNHSREPDVDTAKTAGHFFSSSTRVCSRVLACAPRRRKKTLLSRRESIFFFSFFLSLSPLLFPLAGETFVSC